VYLSIRDGNATVTTGLVEEREVEFGITTPVSFGPTLEAERVATYGFNLVYAERSALAPRSRKLSWKKLPGLPVVGLNPVSSTRLQIDSVLNARGLELPWTIEVDQLATMIGLVQSGNFVTIMPALFEAHGYGLKSIPVLDPDITRDVYIVRRRDSTPTPQGQYLMELVRAYLAR
jgi:DNA-binding transcriptional LysR family regulator